MTNKKILGLIALGGLVLTAPFAAFAASVDDTTNVEKRFGHHMKGQMTGSLLNEPDYEKQIERLEKAIEKKIEQAELLIEQLDDDSDVDISQLEEIVADYVKLETFLEEVEAEKAEADYLKEIFFEYKEDATELTTEFRTILTTNLTDSEIEELRESLKDSRGYGPRFTAETLEMIDSDLALRYSNGELTEKEVMEEVKGIMDAMTEDEKKELFDEMKEAGIESMGPRGEGKGQGMHRGMQ